MKHGNTTHGMSFSRKKRRPRIYRIWLSMKNRCFNKNSPSYRNYGIRGITVCNEWIKFEPFYQWSMSNGYHENLSIDRINNNGDYEPSNCRWTTIKEQANNTRKNRFLEFNGVKKTVSQWAETLGITETSLRERLQRGWTVEKALTTMKIEPAIAARIASEANRHGRYQNGQFTKLP